MARIRCNACSSSGLEGGYAGTIRCSYCDGKGYKTVADPPKKTAKTNQSCFAAGTMIETPIGKLAIEQLNAGDAVTSWDTNRSKTTTCRILKVKSYCSSSVLELRLGNGTMVKTTGLHSFLTSDGWKQARHLSDRDMVQGCRGEGVTILGTKTLPAEPVYNLVTEKHHNFMAAGIVAHNFTYCKALRAFYWRLAVLAQSRLRWKNHAHATA